MKGPTKVTDGAGSHEFSGHYTSPFDYLDKRLARVEQTLYHDQDGLVVAFNTITSQLSSCWFAAKVIGGILLAVALLLVGNIFAMAGRGR